MIVYSGVKKDYLYSVEADTIAQEIEEKVFQKLGRRTVANEYASSSSISALSTWSCTTRSS